MFQQKQKTGATIPVQLKPVKSASIQDNRPQAGIQKKQAEGMSVQRSAINTGAGAPIQLAKWKYQTIGGWQLISGNNTNRGHPFPLNPKDGDLFDDETGIQTRGTKTRQTVESKKTESTGMPLPNTNVVNTNTPKTREVHFQQTQKMRGGPTVYYNSDHNVDSKFAISVDTSAKTCEVIIRIQSSADKSVFSNWAQATSDKWSKRFGLRVLSKSERRSGFYMIDVKLVQVGANDQPHHVVVPQNSDETFAGVRGMKGTRSMTEWGTKDAVDVPHEVGHMLGNLDEYYTINDHVYTAPGENARGGVDVGEGSIMNDPKNNPLAKHYELIRKEAAAAIGTSDKNVTIEEAGHMAQVSNSPMKITRTSTMGSGIDLSVISSSRSNLKKIPSSSNVNTGSVEDEPITDFRGLLKKKTITKPLLPEKTTGTQEEKPNPFGVTLRSTRKQTMDVPPEKSIIPEESPITNTTPSFKPVKKTIHTSELPVPQKEETAPKERRKLPPPPTIVSQAPEEQKQEEIKQEVPVPEKATDKQFRLIVNGFNVLKGLLSKKPQTKQREELAQEVSVLGKTFTGELQQLGEAIFYASDHWDTVVSRMFELKGRIESL